MLVGLIAVALAAAPAAQASFHLIKVREVYAGSAEDSYVELQMYSGGQNFLTNHAMTVYDSSGALVHSSKFASGVANGQNQATVLVGDSGVQAKFGVSPDLADPELAIPAAGGAACWNAGGLPADCVAWGNFNGGAALEAATGTSAGSPVSPSGIPAGSAIRRTIEPGCPSLLEEGDDSDDSAADFTVASPLPRPNSVPPAEQACTAGGGGGGTTGGGAGGGGSSGGAAGKIDTILRRHPARRTHDSTPTFRFAADEAGASFECRLDHKPYRRCRSPFTAKRLAAGSHRFLVRARSGGEVDPTPASWRFRVLPTR